MLDAAKAPRLSVQLPLRPRGTRRKAARLRRTDSPHVACRMLLGRSHLNCTNKCERRGCRRQPDASHVRVLPSPKPQVLRGSNSIQLWPNPPQIGPSSGQSGESRAVPGRNLSLVGRARTNDGLVVGTPSGPERAGGEWLCDGPMMSTLPW